MQIKDLKVVLEVAKQQSITAAAAQLNMSVATASAAVKRVEQHLGVELFVRTTRSLRLSQAGENYLPHCENAITTLDIAGQTLKQQPDVVEGELRIALSSDLGRNRIIPWLDEFIEIHPGIRLAIHISDSNIDFYRDTVDIALRYGSLSDANLYGFKICDIQGVLCASPAYIEQNGQPQNIDELCNHNGLFYQLQDVIHNRWRFSHQGEYYKITMTGNRASNDGDLVRRWCVAGKGVAVKSCLDVSADLLTGRLVRLLSDYQPRVTQLWMVCPSRHTITPAVRVLRDFLQKKTQQILAELSGLGYIDG